MRLDLSHKGFYVIIDIRISQKFYDYAHILFIGRNGVFWLCMAEMVCSAYKGRFMVHLARKRLSSPSSPHIFSLAPLNTT